MSLFQETVDIHLGVLLSAFPAFGFLLAAGWRWCRVQQQLLEKAFAGLSLLKQKMSSVSLDFTFKKINKFTEPETNKIANFGRDQVNVIVSTIKNFPSHKTFDGPFNEAATYDHEQNEEFQDLGGQVHGRSVGEVVRDEAEDGGGAQKVVHRRVESVLRLPVLTGADLRVQRP